MAKNKEQKKEMLSSLQAKIVKAKTIVFASFSGLGVKDNEELRSQLRKENSEYLVVKKTLLGLALEEGGHKGIDIKSMTGQVAAVFGYGDEVTPAKIVDEFKKRHEGKISFAGGILESKFLGISEVEALAKIPSKLELYAQLVGSLNAPVSGFVNVLSGNLRSLVYVLKAIEGKKV